MGSVKRKHRDIEKAAVDEEDEEASREEVESSDGSDYSDEESEREDDSSSSDDDELRATRHDGQDADGDGDDEGNAKKIVNFAFDFAEPGESDFHPLKALLNSYAPSTTFGRSALVDAIINAPSATVIKAAQEGVGEVDEDDMSTVGVGAVLRNSGGLLKGMFGPGGKSKSAKKLDDLFSDENHVVVIERLINSPPQLGGPLLGAIFEGIERGQKKKGRKREGKDCYVVVGKAYLHDGEKGYALPEFGCVVEDGVAEEVIWVDGEGGEGKGDDDGGQQARANQVVMNEYFFIFCAIVLNVSRRFALAQENIVTRQFDARRVEIPGVVYNTSFPPFANLGGPPDLSGALYQEESGYIGMILPSGFTSSLYLGSKQYMLQMGRYLSWECTGAEGEYRATVIRRDLYSNGTIVVSSRCEKGKVVAPDTYYWISSTTACPAVDEPFPEWSKTTISTQNYTTLPDPPFGNLTCGQSSGPEDPSGLDTSSVSGLDAEYVDALGVYELVSPAVIPPPYDRASSGIVPPSFAYSGITPVVDGIWDIDGLNAFRTIAGGGFSIVFYNETTGAFSQALGRYESYECSEYGYRSVATQSSFDEAGVVYFEAAGGCSSAAFIQDGLVGIKTSVNTTCPDVDATGGRMQTRIVPLLEEEVMDRGEERGGPLCVPQSRSGARLGVVAGLVVVFWALVH